MTKENGNIFVGERFGMLVVIADGGRNKHGQVRVVAVCDCGNEKEFSLYHLKSKHTSSCGCNRAISTIATHTTHGKSKDKLYYVWNNMKERCRKENHKDYHYYGGKGVIVCDEWNNDFSAFCQFAINNGYIEGLQIDRIDNNKGYGPDNCRFVTRKVNMNNTRLLSTTNTSGYRGVYYDKNKNKFCSYGSISGYKKFYKRGFLTAKEAAVYRDNYYRNLGVETVFNFQEATSRT